MIELQSSQKNPTSLQLQIHSPEALSTPHRAGSGQPRHDGNIKHGHSAMSPAKPRKLTPRQEAASVDIPSDRLRELADDLKLARLVANENPSASSELLLELLRSDEKAVRKACTSHANTPVEAIWGTCSTARRTRPPSLLEIEGICGGDPAGEEASGHHQLSCPICPGFSQRLLGAIQQAVGCIGSWDEAAHAHA